MKVLFFITRGDTLGGAQTHVITLASNFKLRGHKVLVCVGGGDAIFTEILKDRNIDYLLIPDLINSYNILRDFKVLIKLKKILIDFNPDIFSVHSSKANLIARLLNINSKYNLITTVHGWSFTEGIPFIKRNFNFLLEKLTYKFSSAYILVSKYDLNLGLRSGVLVKKHIVIYNGVEDKFEKKYNTSDDIVITMVARFDKPKNQMKLIEACKNISNIKVVFVGDGPNLETIKSYVKSKAYKNFIFTGLVKNVSKILSESTVFALISNWEGFPISTIEAMSHNLPLLISDVGGACECVYDGVNGFKIPKTASISDIERIIINMISDKSKLSNMGCISRNLYLNHFSDQIMCDQTNDFFNNILIKNV